MRIAFTGHRDRAADPAELAALAALYPTAAWVHGGAAGFDSQVAGCAEQHGIPQVVIRPDYRQHPPRQAPLIRNREIVAGADLLVACYDGRSTGGTAYTVRYAERQGVPVRILRPAEDEEE